MRRSPYNLIQSLRNPGLVAVSIPLGVLTALFATGYELDRLLPPESRLLQAATLGCALLAALGYTLLLRWLWRALEGFSPSRTTILVLAGLVLGSFLFFGGTDRWRSGDLYVSFLLPRHNIAITVLPTTKPPSLALTWLKTSLGDVSLDAIDAPGWKRQGSQLLLETQGQNALAWSGRTGRQIQVVLRGGQPGMRVQFTRDGEEETLAFAEDQINYQREFAVPFYASSLLIKLSGWLVFSILSLALLMVIAGRRLPSVSAIGAQFSDLNPALQGTDGAIILGALCLALLLRGLNLENVFPAVDEYYHLIAAQEIARGAALSSVYQRGLWLTTLPIALALRVFGHQLWAARLIGVVFNSAAIFPLYLLARRINRPVAAVACALYASSPWIITFARVAREYAYYPFYFYWIIYAMVAFVSGIPAGFSVRRDWKMVGRARMLALAAVLAIPPVFALKIDWLSTFRTILIAYLVFGVFVLRRFDWKTRANWPILVAVGVGLFVSAKAWYGEQNDKILALPRLNVVPLEYFLPNPQQQWYFNRVGVVIALAIAAAAALSYLLRIKNFVPLFVLGLFACYLAVFALIAKTFFHTRHLLTTQLWYIIVIALGLYAIWAALRALIPARGLFVGILLGAILGAMVLNVSQIVLPSFSRNPDMPISEDYLHDLSQVQTYILGHAHADDTLVSTVYGLYASWEERPVFRAQYRVTSQTPKADIFSIVDQHASGWIVIDKIRLDLSGLSPRDLTGTHQIEYIGLFGDEYVWHWQHAAAGTGPLPVLE